jgi:hypothetical protein
MIQRRWSSEVDSFEVLHYIKSCGDLGRTNAEIRRHFKISKQTTVLRLIYLRQNGYIRKNGRVRKESEDSVLAAQCIWIATEKE